MNIKIPKKDIFREYDIRGIVEEEIDIDVAYTIGRSFGTLLREINKTQTVVGYDNRSSSLSLFEGLTKGLLESGIDVINIGLVTTPMYYYASNFLNINCGVMITASHSPKEYNGFKVSYNGLFHASGVSVERIYNRIISNDFIIGSGKISFFDIKNEYVKLVTEKINLSNKPLTVVYDCGNGTASIVADEIFKKFNLKLIPLFNTSNSDFPNHHPDPSVKENMIFLQQEVIKNKADIGIGIDGDGDRVGVVDENGNIIPIDKLMIIIWRNICSNLKVRKGLYDVKCSNALKEELIKLNIEPLCYKTGGSLLKAKMIEEKLDFGGELSGHLFFQDKYLGYDDGIYAGLRIIEILSNTDKHLSELLNNINHYFNTQENKIKVTDKNKFIIIDKVKEYCIQKNYNILTIDGVKVLFDDGFALIRASNTGPNLTTRFEAKTEERLNEIEKEFNNIINNIIKIEEK